MGPGYGAVIIKIMSETIKGKVTFINHEKKYVMLEYLQGNRKKTVNGSIDEKVQKQWKEKKLIKKTHHFLVGDEVNFKLELAGRGDRMVATNIDFLYNNMLNVLLDKSKDDNRFLGYLKVVDDKYFVKEIESYLFFPVPFSPWQQIPTEDELNEQVSFSLQNIDRKEKIFAALFDNNYIPEFNAAVKLFKNKTPIEATVYDVKPHGIYLNIVGDKIKAKIALGKDEAADALLKDIKIGDKINVLITHLSKSKIVVGRII